MRRKRHKIPDWRKLRFNRSMPDVLRGQDARDAYENSGEEAKTGVDHVTRWRKISESSFEMLTSKNLLSPTQIKQYHDRVDKEFARNPNKSKAADDRAKKHQTRGIVMKIAEHDLGTIEGLQAFKKILEEHPEAINLIGDAQKLRAENE